MVEAKSKLDKNMDYIVKPINQNIEVCLKKLNQCSRELEEIKEVCLSRRNFNSDITESLVRMDKQLKNPITESLKRIETKMKNPITYSEEPQPKQNTVGSKTNVLLIGNASYLADLNLCLYVS